MRPNKIFFLLCLAYYAHSQPGITYTAVDVEAAIQKLNTLGSVLYVAAHPDDENQALLTYMAKGRHYESAYLSLTRGDGGQNLLGPEKGAFLGVLRTQELLAARRIDGAQQYFTRAIDFGYSKSADESLKKWDRNLILADVVHVIRQTRPDVIITRFSEKFGGHGHHISSAILAKEAFSAAANPNKFPEQLDKLQPWQAKRIYWNSWRPQEERPKNAPALLSLNLGSYNPLLGKSYREIAAKSRSMHKTQGFGATPRRGESKDYFDHMAGEVANNDLFDGIETSWKRVPGSEDIQKLVTKLSTLFNSQDPEALIPALTDLYKLLDKKESAFWIEKKKNEVQKLLQMCSGLWMESIALTDAVSPGDSVEIRTSILNRSDSKIILEKINVSNSADSIFNTEIKKGRIKSTTSKISLPDTLQYSQPYWLKNAAFETMFNVDKDFSGAATHTPQIKTQLTVRFNDLVLSYKIPVLYKWNDPRDGEQYKPFVIQPDVSISLSQNSYIFADAQPKEISVSVVANKNHLAGTIEIELPDGWSKEPGIHSFSLDKLNEQKTVQFRIVPQENAQNGEIRARAIIEGKQFDQQIIQIGYDHIPQQNILNTAKAKLTKLDIIVPDKKIAYIMGSGDEIPQSLQQIGLAVDLLSDSDLQSVNYNIYDAVICGVRAFNTRENLAFHQNRIMDYVEAGGVWIVQHNTRFGSQVGQIGPYPYIARGRSRISEEDAPMEILQPDHHLLNIPNKITAADFEKWVQERGTYMAESWGDNFVPLLAGNDKGESPQKGGLLYSKYGQGTFIFTGLSWFRQLPAGVPGAYRIFVNMICAGDNNS